MSMTSPCRVSCRASCCARRTDMLREGIDAAATRAMPGVSGVFTAADLDADGVGTLPCIARVETGAPMIVPPRRVLARDRVRHVGDPVAFVVARCDFFESRPPALPWDAPAQYNFVEAPRCSARSRVRTRFW